MKKRLFYSLFVIFIFFILINVYKHFHPTLMSISFSEERVVRVVDGDTIVTSSSPKSVRIFGIDSPETKDPRKPVGCGGPEASAWAKAQLPPGTVVRLVEDPTQDSTDRYGRSLRYVEYLKDNKWVDFSEEAARSGNARSYVYGHKPVQHIDEIRAAEAFARENHLGLWGHC